MKGGKGEGEREAVVMRGRREEVKGVGGRGKEEGRETIGKS